MFPLLNNPAEGYKIDVMFGAALAGMFAIIDPSAKGQVNFSDPIPVKFCRQRNALLLHNNGSDFH